MVSFQDSLLFGAYDEHTLHLEGFVECGSGVRLQVTKKFDIRHDGRGRTYVRCYSYNYVGFVPGSHLLLKYHSLHENPDDYIHRVYDPATGAEEFNETLPRYQFPTFPEVLDELEYLAQRV